MRGYTRRRGVVVHIVLDGGSLRRPARGGYLRRRVSWSWLGMAVGWSLYNRVAPNR